MAKGKNKGTETDFERLTLEQESSRRIGFLATITILTIVGVVIWFMMSHGDSD